MNTNTRRSFIQTAIAALAAFFGIRPKADAGFESWKFPRANKETGAMDFHIRITTVKKDPPQGEYTKSPLKYVSGFIATLTTRDDLGQYSHTSLHRNSIGRPFGSSAFETIEPEGISRIVLVQAVTRAIVDKYDEHIGIDPEQPRYKLHDPMNVAGIPEWAPMQFRHNKAMTCSMPQVFEAKGSIITGRELNAGNNFERLRVAYEPGDGIVTAHYFDANGRELWDKKQVYKLA